MSGISAVFPTSFWTSATATSSSDRQSLDFITADASRPGTFRDPYPSSITSELSRADQTINTHVIPGAWPSDTEKITPAHMPLFAYRGTKGSVTFTWEKSVRALNLFLMEQGLAARNFWFPKSPGLPSEAERSGVISAAEWSDLIRTPTSSWMRNPTVNRILADDTNTNKDSLRYLFSDGIAAKWNFIGFKPNEEFPYKSTFSSTPHASSGHAVSFAGHVGGVNNIWGNKIFPMATLGLSLEPIKGRGKLDGIFLLVPMIAQGKRLGRAYTDVSGFPLYSHVYWIGSVKDYTSKPVIVDEPSIWFHLGLTSESSSTFTPDKSLTLWVHR